MTSSAPTPLRLFIGLWPPPDTAEALQAHAEGWSWPPGARRTPAGRLHVTLHFLGEVEHHRLPQLHEALRTHWEGCDLVLDRPQVWPGGIAVLEAGIVPPALGALHADLGDRLQGLGLPVEERRYRPHVTFARKASLARPPGTFAPVRWRVEPPLLVQSLPGGRGYVPLQRFD